MPKPHHRIESGRRSLGASPRAAADSSTAPRRLLVIDDNEVMREGIAAIATRHAGCQVCGYAEDEHSAAKLIEEQSPEVCTVSLFLRNRDGIELIKNFSKRFPNLRIIVHSVEGEELYGPRLLEAGAIAFVPRRASAARFAAVITQICDECRLNGNHQPRRPGACPGNRDRRGIDRLTDRELHVFHLIGRGLGTGRIALDLGLSRKTVEYYREQLKRKLGYPTGEALVQAAVSFSRFRGNAESNSGVAESA